MDTMHLGFRSPAVACEVGHRTASGGAGYVCRAGGGLRNPVKHALQAALDQRNVDVHLQYK